MLLIRPFTTIALIAMALILAPYSICAQTTLLDSLQLHYPLDGNANDESGNGFDGTIFNAVPTTDRYGNDSAAYDFDGSGDWIDSDETFDYQERSVMAWAYLESFTTDQYIFTQDAAAQIDIRFIATGTYVLHENYPSRHESYRIIKQ